MYNVALWKDVSSVIDANTTLEADDNLISQPQNQKRSTSSGRDPRVTDRVATVSRLVSTVSIYRRAGTSALFYAVEKDRNVSLFIGIFRVHVVVV
jgi:hypothetical protein